jgi:hypothetical protein
MIHKKSSIRRWVWWFMPIVPALGRLRQEDNEFDNL